VPFEPLEPGFKGRLFEVDAHDGGTHQDYRHLDLDDRVVLLGNGLRPFSADPLFHQQMVYAVSSLVYAAFRKAPGRHLAWGFEQPDGAERRTRLRLRPYAMLEDNAYYDVSTGELAFGYVRAEPNTMKGQLPRGLVFTSLSHDIIAHGLTHALLDGLRAHSWRRAGPCAVELAGWTHGVGGTAVQGAPPPRAPTPGCLEMSRGHGARRRPAR